MIVKVLGWFIMVVECPRITYRAAVAGFERLNCLTILASNSDRTAGPPEPLADCSCGRASPSSAKLILPIYSTPRENTPLGEMHPQRCQNDGKMTGFSRGRFYRDRDQILYRILYRQNQFCRACATAKTRGSNSIDLS